MRYCNRFHRCAGIVSFLLLHGCILLSIHTTVMAEEPRLGRLVLSHEYVDDFGKDFIVRDPVWLVVGNDSLLIDNGTVSFDIRNAVPSPDGEFLYLLKTALSTSQVKISILHCDAATGILSRQDTLTYQSEYNLNVDVVYCGDRYLLMSTVINIPWAGNVAGIAIFRRDEHGGLVYTGAMAVGLGVYGYLNRIERLQLSADGRYLNGFGYAGEVFESSRITYFFSYEINPASDNLVFRSAIPHTGGYTDAFDLKESPDRRQIYELCGDGLTVLQHDSVTHALNVLFKLGKNDFIPGIATVPRSIEFSTDGNHAYLSLNNHIALFNRSETGELHYAESASYGYTAIKVQLHPEQGELFAWSNNNKLDVFSRDLDAGTVQWRYTFESTSNIFPPETHNLVLSPSGLSLYDIVRDGRIRIYTRDITNTPPIGAFSIDKHSALIDSIFHFDPSASSDFHTYTNQLAARWDYEGDGVWDTEFEPLHSFDRFFPAPGAYHPTMIVHDGEGAYDTVSTEIAVLSREQVQDGRLHFENQMATGTFITMAGSRDGRYAYAVTDEPDGINVFMHDGAAGALQLIQTVPVQEFPIASSATVCLSPDDAYLVMMAPAGIAVMSRHVQHGTLTLRSYSERTAGALTNRSGCFSPDGRYLYEAGEKINIYDWNNFSTHDVALADMRTGELSVSEPPVACTISPDGRFLYVMHANLSASVFSRDTTSGVLTPVSTCQLNGVSYNRSNLGAAFVISPDGRHVYAMSAYNTIPWQLTVHHRDSLSGALTLVETHQKVEDGSINPLQEFLQRGDLAFSPDGRHLYVTQRDNYPSVLVFAREPETGRLLFVESHRNGQANVAGLKGVRSAWIPPDGAHLYCAGTGDNALVMFKRAIPTAISDLTNQASHPTSFHLYPNYPNPFNPTTTIRYVLPRDTRVRLAIYDLLGRRVITLADLEQSAGEYTTSWDGRNGNGVAVASGIYIYRLEARAFVESRKMLMIK